MKVSRRHLAQSIAAAAVTTAVTTAISSEATAQQPGEPGSASTPELDQARNQARGAALQLAQVDLPMETQPAFRFAPRG